MRQLTGLDASFFNLETARTPMHIGSVAIYAPVEGRPAPRFTDIRDFMASRLHRGPALTERVVKLPFDLDRPYWIRDPDFHIERHLHHTALPAPGGWAELFRLASRVFSAPLDEDQPLWEAYVVEGLQGIPGLPEGAYAIVSKVHHAAVDGLSGVEIMAASHDLQPDQALEPAPRDGPAPERVPTTAALLRRTLRRGPLRPVQAVQTAAELARGLGRGAAVLARDALSDRRQPTRFFAPRTRFNHVVSSRRTYGGVRLSLPDLQAVKASLPGAKLNDVILTMVGGALRRHLDALGELPDAPLLSMVPVSVRADAHKRELGNRVNMMSVPLATDVADPLERLAVIHDNQRARKELLHAVGAEQLQTYSELFPSALAGLAARVYTGWGLANRFAQFFNTVITNVPGPRVPIYNAGAQMRTMFGLVPVFDGVGLGHVVNSYLDELTVSFNACRVMLPDPDVYAAQLEDSYRELLERSSSASTRSSSSSRR